MKTLILTASYGGGHNAAANDIKDKFEEKGNEVEIIDFVNQIGSAGEKTKNFHEQILVEKLKFLRKIAFKLSNYQPINNFIQKRLNGKYKAKLQTILEEKKAELIIITNPLWLPFLDQEKQSKSSVIVTDAIDIHSFWYKKDIKHYFLIDKYTKEGFIKKFGHDKDHVHALFFPMKKEFFINKEKIEKEKVFFLLDSQKYKFAHQLLTLLDRDDDIKEIVVIKHRNQKVFDKLKITHTRSSKIRFEDFVNLKENYGNIDIFIGKPGGAVITECIATSTPIIVTTFIPGQEEGNIQLIEKLGVGFYDNDAEKIVEKIDNMDWNTALENFETTKNPNVLEDIYKVLTSE